MSSAITGAFVSARRGKLFTDAATFVKGERPHLVALRRKLLEGFARGAAPGVESKSEVDAILNLLTLPEYPVLEKINLLLFYRDWSDRENLGRAAKKIALEARAYIEAPSATGRYRLAVGHFGWDMVAQLRRDYGLKQQYLGLHTFVAMSSGLPRNLLIILKHVYQWATYNGENPFGGEPITEESQRLGVLDAANWFYEDNRVKGRTGDAGEAAVRRLATLFRDVRFADKPSECSVIAFSVDATHLTAGALDVLRWVEERGLLLAIRGGQRDRNTERIDEKFQLNSMLCPRWDLPVARRGTLALSRREVNAIFDPELSSQFEEVEQERIERMAAPFFGRQPAKFDDHPTLFGRGDG